MQNADTALAEYLAGNKAAFDTIVDETQRGLLRYATGILNDRSAAQDVVQETFVRLLKAADTLREPGKLSSWLYRTCRNLAIDRMRKERQVERLTGQSEASLPDTSASVAGTVEKKELLETVRERMQKLSQNQQDCITLKLLDGKSYKEISAITGLSVSNVGFQIHDGLKKLAALVGARPRGGGRRGM